MIKSSVRSKQPICAAWTHDRLIHERAMVLGQAIDVGTFKNYGSALNSYLVFVRLHNFTIDPTPETLSFYTVFMSHHIKPDSVNTYLSGICHQLEPFFPYVHQSRKSKLVKGTLRDCKRLHGSTITRKLPLSVSNIELIFSALCKSFVHDNLLFLAQLLTGFYALLRLGELTFPNNKSLQNTKSLKEAPLSFLLATINFFSHITKPILRLKAT